MSDSPNISVGFPYDENLAPIYKKLRIPPGAPLPGAVYGYMNGENPTFMTCTALNVGDKGNRWKATIATVVFGDAIVSEVGQPSWVKEVWLVSIPHFSELSSVGRHLSPAASAAHANGSPGKPPPPGQKARA